MLKSLLASRTRPAWQDTFWRVVAGLGIAWFLVVACTAFLREAKALRVARQAIEIKQVSRADEILTKFIQRHPKDDQGLFLATRAAIRLEKLPETASLRKRVQQEAPDLMEALDADIGEVVDGSIAGKGCQATSLLGYYDMSAVLGDPFRKRILDDTQRAARGCLASETSQRAAFQVVVGLVKRGVGLEIVEDTYLSPLRQALSQGHYRAAKNLAQNAAQISPETSKAVDSALEEVRGKVETSIARLEEVCHAIRSAPENRIGRFWCFPGSAPPAATNTLDGWGRSFSYKALNLDETLHCYQGFELSTFGADGKETDQNVDDPDTDISCRFPGRRGLDGNLDGFWRKRS